MVALPPAHTDPQPAPPGVAGLAQAERRLPFPSCHEAVSHLRSPAPCSYTSVPDEAICLLPPRPSRLASARTGALPAVRGGSRDYRACSAPLPRPSVCQGSFLETLGLKSAWYDAAAIRMLAAFVSRTLTAYPRESPSPRTQAQPLLTPSHIVCRPGFGVSCIHCPQ